ncbi:MAG: thioredoxin fold domain-containing protein [Flavobacteriales bacterium]
MKLINLTLIAILTFGLSTSFTTTNKDLIEKEVAELNWFTDFQKADAESKKTGKPIFGFFTGSDWCGWCTRLKRAVFAKDDFKKWANESVILLELDFPRRKKLPANLVQQNQQLARAFGVRGYPTVWIFTTTRKPNTNEINLNRWGSLSYPRAEAGKESQKFLADAERIFATQKK